MPSTAPRPSYSFGYAPRNGVPEYPQLLTGLVFAFVPALGPTGSNQTCLREITCGIPLNRGDSTALTGAHWPIRQGVQAYDIPVTYPAAISQSFGSAVTLPKQNIPNMSIACWVYPTAQPTTTRHFLLQGSVSAPSPGMTIEDGSGNFYSRVSTGSGGGTISIYLDGKLASTASNAGIATLTTTTPNGRLSGTPRINRWTLFGVGIRNRRVVSPTTLSIGGVNGYDACAGASIALLTIWNRLLSPNEWDLLQCIGPGAGMFAVRQPRWAAASVAAPEAGQPFAMRRQHSYRVFGRS